MQVTYTLLRNRVDTQRVVSCYGNLLTDGLQIARQGDYGCTVRTALAIRGIDPCHPSVESETFRTVIDYHTVCSRIEQVGIGEWRTCNVGHLPVHVEYIVIVCRQSRQADGDNSLVGVRRVIKRVLHA